MQVLLQTLVAPLGRLLGVPRRLLGSGVGGLQGVFQILVATSFCWFVASSMYIYPHSLPYANELVGGPVHLPEHLLSSNVDWGQDLRYVKSFLSQKDIRLEDHRLAYYGSVAPKYVGFPKVELVKCERIGEMSSILSKGRNLISVNLSSGSYGFAYSGTSRTYVSPVGPGGVLPRHVPEARLGYSVNIYLVE